MFAASDLKINVLDDAVVRHINAQEYGSNRTSHTEYYQQRESVGLIIEAIILAKGGPAVRFLGIGRLRTEPLRSCRVRVTATS
jgi:hypothetical protein